jgi:hypothetical protein
MAVLDFREIPEAHVGTGVQDTFEQFACEFLELLSMHVIDRASRGADGGKDLVVEDVRLGKLGKSTIRYLVSCKHKVFSGKAVSPSDENDIDDRVKANGCDAFLGMYSTIPTAALDDKLKGLGFEYEIFDASRIEKHILHSSEGINLAQRYFPTSISKWTTENPEPALIFQEILRLDCEICGRNLLDKVKPMSFLGGVLGYCTRLDSLGDDEPAIVDVCWYCKVKCMSAAEKRLKQRNLQEDGWDDIYDFLHPTAFVTRLGNNWDIIARMGSPAREKFTRFLRCTFQYVSRPLTSTEKEVQERELNFWLSD